jgi:histidine triad (HIT) family protein
MSDDCVFCKIAAGKIPSHTIHDDREVFAFLDIRPLTKGHALVVPKRHYVRIEDMPANEAATMMWTVHSLLPKLRAAVGAPSTTIAINNGKEAGQEVPHVHIHLVPRSDGDGGGPVHALFSKRPTVAPDELARLAQAIRGSAPAR